MSTYQNIIDQTRPVPSRPRMPRQNRAKIFSSYQALKGFGEAIHSMDAVFVPRPELTEYAQECLDRKLRQLRRWDTITVTWFRPKEGGTDRDLGRYVTTTGTVECIDLIFRVLLLSGQRIPMEAITQLRGEGLDGMYC